MPINLFVPSKNRSCQLDLLLRSLQKNAPGLFNPYVLFTFTGENFYEGYMKCFAAHPEVTFQLETNAKDNFYGFLDRNKRKIICLMTDDCFIYRKFTTTENEIKYFLSQNDIWSVHTRIGKNIKIVDYVTNKPCPLPNTYEIIDNKFMKYSYRNNGPNPYDCYFLFCTPFDGSFYNASDLIWLSNNEPFEGMIWFEHLICHNGMQQKTPKDKIVCPLLSNTIALQYNSSHIYGQHTNHAFNVSLQEMNDHYLKNEIIDIDSMDVSQVNCAHGEIPFKWKKV